MIESLYIHIPYCEFICFCCDFYQIKTNDKKDTIKNFLYNLKKELKNLNFKMNLKTIYIGGGDPSSLNIKFLEEILLNLKKISNNIFEYTIEINPYSITEEKINLFKKYNINRLNFNIKTFDKKLSDKINQKYSIKEFIKIYTKAKKKGFYNVSFDLIYNIPTQTLKHIKKDLKYIKKLNPNHVSWSSFIIDNYKFTNEKYKKIQINDYKFNKYIKKKLHKMKFKQYEISNFYKKNIKNKSMHNLSYWTNKEYIGIGPSAVSFVKKNNKKILINNTKEENWIKEINILSIKDYFFQIIMMGLRLKDGIDINNIKDSYYAISFFHKKIKNEIKNKNLYFNKNKLKCTKKGYEILDNILINLL